MQPNQENYDKTQKLSYKIIQYITMEVAMATSPKQQDVFDTHGLSEWQMSIYIIS